MKNEVNHVISGAIFISSLFVHTLKQASMAGVSDPDKVIFVFLAFLVLMSGAIFLGSGLPD